jgi:hypothetical protein
MRIPAAAFEIRFTTNISRFINESDISKKYLSSILCTLKRPSSVFALSVITSLYGRGPELGVGVGNLLVESLVDGCANALTQRVTEIHIKKHFFKNGNILTGLLFFKSLNIRKAMAKI